MRSPKTARSKYAERNAQGDIDAAPDVLAAVESSSSSTNLCSQQNLKTAAKRPSHRDGTDIGPVSKRRRRAFSCLSCQKLKCRCEYEPGATGCHRCQTLRIDCSLRADGIPSHTSPPSLNVEERLQRHEDSLQEIKDMIKRLASQGNPSDISSSPSKNVSTRSDERGTPTLVDDHASPEYFSNPADKGTNTAPVVVLREINEQAHRGYRKLLGHINLDLVQLQLLDEQTAAELIQLFLRYQSHMLLVCSGEDLIQRNDTHKASALLYSVCCLVGIVYRPDICGTTEHRQIYEQIRIALGQALLGSPLSLDEINAILIMSNNANTPSQYGVEYIDSWLLSGYCAQQAMLSISFSKIVNNIKHSHPTADDYSAMHLWSTICLHHLHWAATTGRPSIIPTSYVNQCNILLNFYRSTMQDGMIVAEIMLYSALHQKLSRRSYLDDSDECEEFLSWRQKWNYLLALPTSAMLRIGYHAAYLILAIRSLEETGHGLESTAFLSPTTADVSNDGDDGGEAGEAGEARGVDRLRIVACGHAKLVLQTFLEMPRFLMDGVPTCFCLCIGYCALMLAHLDASRSRVPDHVTLDLITRLDRWITESPGKAWSFKYCKLARDKVEARINASSSGRPAVAPWKPAGHGPESDTVLREAGAGAREEGSQGGLRYHHNHSTACTTPESLPLSSARPTDPDTAYPRFELTGQLAFPSMEDFFGGGFLGLME
ncbi:hypothetical protein F4810DRAFT_716077 [Camillea tinctor]|nr:hypothetical protein F4810DRAFT_716077 [Camillea tinctor]